jgi:hypothetical protein
MPNGEGGGGACLHSQHQIRYVTFDDGSKHLVRQCVDCFAIIRLPDQPGQYLPYARALVEQGDLIAPVAEQPSLFPQAKPLLQIRLNHNHTRRVKQQARERGGNRCVVCGSTHNIEAHHLTYERLGFERVEDFELKCRKHHREGHGFTMERDVIYFDVEQIR